MIVAGPTASGKSARALAIAEAAGGVIINADSQQVYRDLRILTARPSAGEEARAPHRLYGFMAANESCSAGKWLRLAKMEIDWVLAEGRTPIIVGGTGLYIKALMQGIAEIPDIEASVRQQAAGDFEQMGKEAFAERLRHVDPEFFTRLKVYDKQRLIRAYAVWLGSGKPLSFWQQQPTSRPYAPDDFNLEIISLPRDELYARCDLRVHAMIEEGAVEEVKNLMTYDLPSMAALEKTIGVRELTSYIKKEISLDAAIAQMQQATRNYAKRQETWFRPQLMV
jgi:tRNA dimethylallyltransferase